METLPPPTEPATPTASQNMLTKEEIAAIIANFAYAEMQQFHDNLINHELIPTNVIGGIVVSIQAHREETQQADDTAAEAAGNQDAAANDADMTPQELRKKAAEQVPAMRQKAMKSMDAAQRLCGGQAGRHAWVFRNAKEAIQADTDPPARGAAEAQRLVHKVLKNCPDRAEKAVKKADRDIRDVVVLQCRAICEDPKDRDLFLQKATEAYKGAGGELEKEVRAQLLLAYHKDPTNQRNGFTSNNQIAADRKGGPRPRRRPPSRGRSPNRTHTRRAARDEPPAAAAHSPSRVRPMTQEATRKEPPLCADAPGEPPSPMYVNPEHLTAARQRSLTPGDSLVRRPQSRARLNDTRSPVGPTLLLVDNDEKVHQHNPRGPGKPTGQQQEQQTRVDTDLWQRQQPEEWIWINDGCSHYQAGATMAGALHEGYYIPTYNMYGASVADGSGGWNHPNASGSYQPPSSVV